MRIASQVFDRNKVQGVFGDLKARVIRLNRRSKKRRAAAVIGSRGAGSGLNSSPTRALLALGLVWSLRYAYGRYAARRKSAHIVRELRGGTRGRLKLHNFRSTPPRALPDSNRELQRAVADLYCWGAICRSGIELFLMKATWNPWFVCGNRTRNSVKRYEQLYRGAENPALLV